MPSGELVGTTLKFTGREVTDGHSHFSNIFTITAAVATTVTTVTTAANAAVSATIFV
jgi:hypothetical protein